jgi:hypothetical protein
MSASRGSRAMPVDPLPDRRFEFCLFGGVYRSKCEHFVCAFGPVTTAAAPPRVERAPPGSWNGHPGKPADFASQPNFPQLAE